MNKKIVVLFVLLGWALCCNAQADLHFSQFYKISILRNPALTGVFDGDYKFGVYFRQQWNSIASPYTTMMATAESRVALSQTSEDFLSYGFLAFSDKAGSLDQTITSFYPAINYNKSLNADHRSFLSVGITGGYIQYSFDPGKATFNSQFIDEEFDPGAPTGERLPKPKMGFWDMGTGVGYNTSFGDLNKTTLILGMAGYHFNNPSLSYYHTPGVNLNTRWNGNAALNYSINDNLDLQAQGNYAHQGTYEEIIAGVILNGAFHSAMTTQLFGFGAGAFYRVNDAIIPTIKVKYENVFLHVSYDVNVSTLKDASNLQGAWEITCFYIGNYKGGKDGATRKLMCPNF